jgi:hypothetical protein
MAHQKIQVPPDSTGKQVWHRVEVIVTYDNGTIDFSIGDTVVGETSGFYGSILHIDGTTATGEIHVLLNSESVEQVTDGENLQVESVTYATANGTITNSNKYYIPQTMLQGANNTANSTYVDQYGALYTRGKDGHFSFDAFGNQNSEGNIVLGQHLFRYGLDLTHSTITTSGGGTLTHNVSIPACVFSTGLTFGDRSQYSTDKYFHMDPGHSTQIAVAGYIGDSGKTGVTRKWGYYDDEEGCYFELTGTTLYIVVKNSHTGYEYKIPQSQWNGDRVNGAGGSKNLSGYDLDLTKTNVYIIEFQNAAGYVFFKVMTDQGIATVHTFPMVNNFTGSVTGHHLLHLPFRAEQYNTSSVGSTSEAYLTGYIILQSTSDYSVKRRANSVELDLVDIAGDGDYHALATVHMNKQFIQTNGNPVAENRSLVVPQDIQIYASGGPISVAACINPTMDGTETWAVSASNLVIDTTGDYSDIGKVVQYNMVKDGEIWRFDHLTDGGGIRENSPMLTRKADIDATPMYVGIAIKSITNVPVKVSATISWYEVGA